MKGICSTFWNKSREIMSLSLYGNLKFNYALQVSSEDLLRIFQLLFQMNRQHSPMTWTSYGICMQHYLPEEQIVYLYERWYRNQVIICQKLQMFSSYFSVLLYIINLWEENVTFSSYKCQLWPFKTINYKSMIFID